ncbi:MAG: hypothetical protein ACRCTE_12505 [Cellulosilyticaceae bacterium]
MGFVMKYDFILDMLCAFNVLTGDAFYTQHHQEVYDQFAPRLTEPALGALEVLKQEFGGSKIGPELCYMLSLEEDFSRKTIKECFENADEIVAKMKRPELNDKVHHVCKAVLVLGEELIKLGLHTYWLENALPQIQDKMTVLEAYLRGYDLYSEITQFVPMSGEDIVLWLCAYAAPHDIKMDGQQYIADMSWSQEDILVAAAHEMLNPPYDKTLVQEELRWLGECEWVDLAFKAQKGQSGEQEKDIFITENIAEALGLYIANKIGIESQPEGCLENFKKKHHVIVPYFYEYLQGYHKEAGESFEVFFKQFVEDYLPSQVE